MWNAIDHFHPIIATFRSETTPEFSGQAAGWIQMTVDEQPDARIESVSHSV